MKIHILGICGTFMSGLALLAKEQGHAVTGSDQHCYPPMSTQLEQVGIQLYEGYQAEHLQAVSPDCVIVGNALSRGNPALEFLLSHKLPYYSGPAWLLAHLLPQRHVLAVAGTHGKTTTSSMLAWMLESAGLNPSFLIGGIPQNFNASARLTDSDYIVLEADEYDSAFDDKRPKFMHFHPDTLVINAVEFDHADIYHDLADIKRQFHYLLRTVPGNGNIIALADDPHVNDIIQQGCWTPITRAGLKTGDWKIGEHAADGSRWEVIYQDSCVGRVDWQLIGRHNMSNGILALAAAASVGVSPEQAITGLNSFKTVKRRLERLGVVNDITIYDDFAHHPTAIKTTLAGLRAHMNATACKGRLIAVAECGSYTMRNGYHADHLPAAFNDADRVLLRQPCAEQNKWDFEKLAKNFTVPVSLYSSTISIIDDLKISWRPYDHVVIMSNSGFDNMREKILAALAVLNA